MVSKSDITSNIPSTTDLIQVQSGETVLAETENANNLLNLNAIILAFNWIIDSGVELTATNIFTAAQTFSAGLKAGQIDPLTTNGNLIINIGTGNFCKNSVGANNVYQTKSEVDALILAAGTLSLNYAKDTIQTGAFNAIAGKMYPINTTSSAFTATLNASPSNGDLVGFVDIKGTFNVNNFTIDPNGKSIMDLSENLVADKRYAKIYLTYDSTSGSWYLI